MGTVTAYLRNKLVDHAFGPGTFAKPTMYLALTVSGTEVSTSGTGYGRRATSAFTVTDNVASLAADTDFSVALVDWGTIDGAALYDAVTGGNKLADGALATPKFIGTGDIFRALAAGITFTLT